MKVIPDTHLGDGVYASSEDYDIVLDLRGQDCHTRIVLEPSVMEALFRYSIAVRDAIKLILNAKKESEVDEQNTEKKT